MFDLTVGDLAPIVGGRLSLGSLPPLGGTLEPIRRIVTDSREAGPGTVYWAVDQPHQRGAWFAEDAFLRSALGVVAAGRHVEPWAGTFTVQVDDATWALWQLAAWCRRRFQGHVVAVVEGPGQTTTRGMMQAVLSGCFPGTVCDTAGPSHLGIATALLQLKPQDSFALLEIPGEAEENEDIHAISHLCCPEIAAITWPRSMQRGSTSTRAIAPNLSEVLESLPTSGWAIIDGDDPELRKLAAEAGCNVLLAGCGPDCDVQANHVRCKPEGLQFDLERQAFHIPNVGKPSLTPALAAIAAGRLLGLTLSEVAESLAAWNEQPSAHMARQAA